MISCISLICCLNPSTVFSQYVGQFSSTQTIKPQIEVKAYCFNLQDVKLLNSRFKDNMERDGKWLLSIENDRLLHSWLVNAGVPTNAQPFGGWEGLDVELSILAGNMGIEGMKSPVPFAHDQLDYKDYDVPVYIITSLNVNGKNLSDCVVPVKDKPLAFNIINTAAKEITLIPFYQVNKQRYVIYSNLK
ncbi:MAG: beta-L-arabinofuranosidase domain-containing protein [Ignavibacteriaceae bacterium]